MSDRIHWLCACSGLLSAPAEWRGRQVRCPACGAAQVVPQTSDASATARARQDRSAWQDRRAAPEDARSGESPYSGWELRTEGGPPRDDPFFRRFHVDPRAARRAARRKWWILAGVIAAVALVIGGGLVSRHLWKTRWSAAARMERAGFGRKVTGHRPAPWQEALQAVGSAQRRLEAANDGREAATALRDAFLSALLEADVMPLEPRAHLYNNAAWFFLTTAHEDLRDPPRALRMAQEAVDWTGRARPEMLDTLAEALAAAGRPSEAAAMELQVLAMEPGNAFYRAQATRFHAEAGLPPPAFPAPLPEAPPGPAAAPATDP